MFKSPGIKLPRADEVQRTRAQRYKEGTDRLVVENKNPHEVMPEPRTEVVLEPAPPFSVQDIDAAFRYYLGLGYAILTPIPIKKYKIKINTKRIY